MANKVPVVVDQTTGRSSKLTSSDTLTDASGTTVGGGGTATIENETRGRLTQGVSLDLSSTGNTNLFTATQNVIVEAVVFRCTAATGITTPATVEINNNVGDVLIPATLLTGFDAAEETHHFIVDGRGRRVKTNETLRANVTVAFTGTSMTVECFVLGYAETGSIASPGLPDGPILDFVHYALDGNQSIAHSTTTVIDFDEKISDPNGNVTTGASWKYTVPSSGKLLIAGGARYDSGAAWPSNGFLGLQLFKNGSILHFIHTLETNAVVRPYDLYGTMSFDVVTGDEIDLRIFQNSGIARDIVDDNARSYVTLTLYGTPTGSVAGGLLNKVTSIDLSSTGTTDLITVPTDQEFVITDVLLQVTAESGSSGSLAAGVGIAAGEDDIFDSQTILGLDAVGKVFRFGGTSTGATADSTDVVKLGVDTAVSGTLTVTAYIFGFETSQATVAGQGISTTKLTRSAAQTIATSASTNIDWQGTDAWDVGLWTHDGGGANPDRLIAPSGFVGNYAHVALNVEWTSNATGRRSIAIIQFDSGDTEKDRCQHIEDAVSSAVTIMNCSDVFELADGDYFVASVFQSSGGNLDILHIAGSARRTQMSAYLLR